MKHRPADGKRRIHWTHLLVLVICPNRPPLNQAHTQKSLTTPFWSLIVRVDIDERYFSFFPSDKTIQRDVDLEKPNPWALFHAECHYLQIRRCRHKQMKCWLQYCGHRFILLVVDQHRKLRHSDSAFTMGNSVACHLKWPWSCSCQNIGDASCCQQMTLVSANNRPCCKLNVHWENIRPIVRHAEVWWEMFSAQTTVKQIYWTHEKNEQRQRLVPRQYGQRTNGTKISYYAQPGSEH